MYSVCEEGEEDSLTVLLCCGTPGTGFRYQDNQLIRAATMFSKPSLGVLIALTARLVTSQQNVDLTGWYGLRGGTVNHILYLEGGNPTNGGQPVNNDGGFLWKFQYCQPFDMSKDTFSKITTPLRETLDNQAPSYVGGGLFATNNEFYTYG